MLSLSHRRSWEPLLEPSWVICCRETASQACERDCSSEGWRHGDENCFRYRSSHQKPVPLVKGKSAHTTEHRTWRMVWKRTLSKDQTHTIHWATARFLRCQTTSYTNSVMFCFPCLKSDFLWNLCHCKKNSLETPPPPLLDHFSGIFFPSGRTHSCLYSCKHSDLQTAQYNQSDLLAAELHHWSIWCPSQVCAVNTSYSQQPLSLAWRLKMGETPPTCNVDIS